MNELASDTCISLCEQELHLHYERSVYWPKSKTLIVADVHLGKESVFQRSGMGLPSGIAQSDISRLAELANLYRPERLLVLGDVVHALPSREEKWVSELSRWLNAMSELCMVVVQGNHDKAGVADVLDARIQWHKALLEPPFYFAHEPVESEEGYVMSGHLHPTISIGYEAVDRMRMPVFWMREALAVLPAFGSFVGGRNIKPTKRDQVYGVGPDGVMRLQ